MRHREEWIADRHPLERLKGARLSLGLGKHFTDTDLPMTLNKALTLQVKRTTQPKSKLGLTVPPTTDKEVDALKAQKER